MQLSEFNTADRETAAATVAVWAAVPAWVDAVVAARPYASVGEVAARADRTLLMVAGRALRLDDPRSLL